MSPSKKILIWGTGIGVWLFVCGFVLFANSVTREPRISESKADGIVVLTGEGVRLKEGARLFSEGRASRLLITGVNKKTRQRDITRLTGIGEDQFACCVDLGYQALNTTGNAGETRAWVRAYKVKNLIVVTSSYHMPRSLAELSRELPKVNFIPHAVLPSRFKERAWWLHYDSARILLSEYVKFLFARTRLAATRAVNNWNGNSVASSVGPSPISNL